MAPEVVLQQANYDEKVDIYSMGMIFWFISTGQRPFEGADPEVIAIMTSEKKMRPDPSSMRSPDLAALVQTMWAHEAGMRPSAQSIVSQASRFEGSGGEIADRTTLSRDKDCSSCTCNIL